jgi:hypothetical protein
MRAGHNNELMELLNLYCIIFPNGKKYYGVETAGKTNRWKDHIRTAKAGKCQYRIYKALRKYGPENCKFVYIYQGMPRDYILKLEMQFIKSYKTQDPKFGYNTTAGGEGAWGVRHGPLTDETRKIMGDHSRRRHAEGKFWSPEGKAIIAAKQSARNKAKYAAMSPEDRKQITAAAHKAIKENGFSEQARKNFKDAQARRSPEQKAFAAKRMEEGRKFMRPEAKAKMREVSRQNSKALWAKKRAEDPSWSPAKKGPQTPEQKAASGAAVKASWLIRKAQGLPYHPNKAAKKLQLTI